MQIGPKVDALLLLCGPSCPSLARENDVSVLYAVSVSLFGQYSSLRFLSVASAAPALMAAADAAIGTARGDACCLFDIFLAVKFISITFISA
jgi:hypothetical protein